MKKHHFFLIVTAILILVAFAAPVISQRIIDTDGDTVPDIRDNCPAVPGLPENAGCPLPDTGGAPDQDGDGVADFVDECPDQAGTGFTNGCPVEAVPDVPNVQPVQPQLVMVWESTSECMVGIPLTSVANINVREHPTTSSAVIGLLAPGQQFAPFFRDYDENNAVWFGGAPAGDSWGWVAGFVLIDNGQCANLPMIVYADAADGAEDLLLTLNVSELDLMVDDPTSESLAGVDWDLLTWEGNDWIVITDGQSLMERRICRFCDFSFTHLIDKSSPVLDGGGGNPPATQPAPQPTSAPAPARPLPVLLVIADMNAADCTAVSGEYCLLMALQLPEFGDEPGQCPPDSASKKALPKLLQAAVKGKVFKKVEIHGTAAPSDEPGAAPGFTLAGDGSVMPITSEESIGAWDYGCAITGYVPSGLSEVMGDGSVRVGFETFVLLPAVQGE